MNATIRFFAVLALALPIFTATGCGDECADRETIPESSLMFPGKIFPISWSFGGGDSSSSYTHEILANWSVFAPISGHPGYYEGGTYRHSIGDDHFDNYLDLQTGRFFYQREKPLFESKPAHPDDGGDVGEYLNRVHQILFNYYSAIEYQNPRCAACANVVYFSRMLTELLTRHEFTDAYLIPPERLYFGGRLHYSNLFLQDGGCGWSACIDFTVKIGATINLDQDYPESSSHYGLEVSSWLYTRELDLETGILRIRYDTFAPSDPSYLKKISEVRETVCSLYDKSIDNAEPWMYTKIPLIKETCDYLQYVIDRQAAPGP